MEVIKKIILRALTTETVPCTGTTGTCHVIVPDLNAVYQMKLNITSEVKDIGFFDAFFTGGTTPIPPIPEPELAIVSTGTLQNATTLFKFIIDNNIYYDGNTDILEYGILSVSDIIYGTDSTLIYENSPTYVFKQTGILSTPFIIPHTWGMKIIPQVNKIIYYRAFARNSVGIAYGVVKNAFISDGGLPLI